MLNQFISSQYGTETEQILKTTALLCIRRQKQRNVTTRSTTRWRYGMLTGVHISLILLLINACLSKRLQPGSESISPEIPDAQKIPDKPIILPPIVIETKKDEKDKESKSGKDELLNSGEIKIENKPKTEDQVMSTDQRQNIDTDSTAENNVAMGTGAAGSGQAKPQTEEEKAVVDAPVTMTTTPATDNNVLPKQEKEDIPSFDEWKKQQIAEEQERKREDAIVHLSVGGDKKTRPNSMRANYASLSCGAKIQTSNPEAQHGSYVLSDNKDEYMINPCNVKKWFVVELCEPIQLKFLEIANFELFSSLPKSFHVFISERYPTKEWDFLGTFYAREERKIQSFPIPGQELYKKFIKIEVVDYYGKEHFCPLSMLRAYGISYTEDEYEHVAGGENNDEHLAADADSSSSSSVNTEKESSNIFTSATDAMFKLVKKVLKGTDEETTQQTDSANTVAAAAADRLRDPCKGSSSTDNNVTCNRTADGKQLPCLQGATPFPIVPPDNRALPEIPTGNIQAVYIGNTELYCNTLGGIAVFVIEACLSTSSTDSTSLTSRCSVCESVRCQPVKSTPFFGSRSCIYYYFLLSAVSSWRPKSCRATRNAVIRSEKPRTESGDIEGTTSVPAGPAMPDADIHPDKTTITKTVVVDDGQTILPSIDDMNRYRETIGENLVETAGPLEVATSGMDVTRIQPTVSQKTDVDRAADNTVETVTGEPAIVVNQCSDGICSVITRTPVLSSSLSTTDLNAESSVRSAPTTTPQQSTIVASVVAGISTAGPKVLEGKPGDGAVNTAQPVNTAAPSTDGKEKQSDPSARLDADNGAANKVKVESFNGADLNSDKNVDNQNNNIDKQTAETSSENIKNRAPLTDESGTPNQQQSAQQSVENNNVESTHVVIETNNNHVNNGDNIVHTPATAASAAATDSEKIQQQKVMPSDASLPPVKRESAIMRLNNRIKNLEANLSLTNRYLDELSQRYKKQIENMHLSFDKTIQKLQETAQSAEMRDLKQQENIAALQTQIHGLHDNVGNLTKQIDRMYVQALESHLFFMIIEAFILIFVIAMCVRRSRQRATRAELQELLKNMPTQPSSVTLRRLSDSTLTQSPAKSINNKLSGSDSNLYIVEPSIPFFLTEKREPALVEKKKKKRKRSSNKLNSGSGGSKSATNSSVVSAGLLFGTQQHDSWLSRQQHWNHGLQKSYSTGEMLPVFENDSSSISGQSGDTLQTGYRSAAETVHRYPQQSKQPRKNHSVQINGNVSNIDNIGPHRGAGPARQNYARYNKKKDWDKKFDLARKSHTTDWDPDAFLDPFDTFPTSGAPGGGTTSQRNPISSAPGGGTTSQRNPTSGALGGGTSQRNPTSGAPGGGTLSQRKTTNSLPSNSPRMPRKQLNDLNFCSQSDYNGYRGSAGVKHRRPLVINNNNNNNNNSNNINHKQYNYKDDSSLPYQLR
ncbi:SUN domain-containing ossification factor-like isoform X2 [Tubulanus polymorphus]|uniref:SUN domain-containing ossification factor-like isoform X2 n=1 Tax=Tubulanus polymorphus TaxID=672921 RepID=UPI003DA251FE